MREEDRKMWIEVIESELEVMLILTFGIVLGITVASASPLYINITDNQTMLLDVTWNGSAYQLNMTYYLQGYNSTTNFTAINYTHNYNITNVNITCYNCSLNYTYNYFYNSSGTNYLFNWTGINQTDLDKVSLSNDNKITSVQSEMTSKYNDVNGKIDTVSADLKSFKDEKDSSFIILWITAGAGVVLALISLLLIWGATRQ